jgi:alcohol dehydrogenase (cytochrome c)
VEIGGILSTNPQTRPFYFMALHKCHIYFSRPQPFVKAGSKYNTGFERIPGEPGKKTFVAFSVESGKLAWRYLQAGEGRSWAGTMSTARGLVFFGDDAESFEALDARDSAVLWNFNTGQNTHDSLMSYSVKGPQHVATASGCDLYSLVLPRQCISVSSK